MTDATIVTIVSAIIGAIPATLVAYAALKKAEVVEKKSDTIIEKAVEIHTLTNSQLSKVTAALEVANEKIQGLEKMLTKVEGQTNGHGHSNT
jgi:5-bromo-4-chloroindolyl phosphate hydrolysis protein